jgi:RimJ/RimL family protein N-acetyltransferase
VALVPDSDVVGPWVCERTGGTWTPQDSVAIGWEKNGALVAGVVFDLYNGASICMHVASDGSKRWLTREFRRFCFRYAFEQLKVKKVIGIVPSTNEDALKFDANLGFIEEHRITDAHPEGDLVLLSMTKQQCRWL